MSFALLNFCVLASAAEALPELTAGDLRLVLRPSSQGIAIAHLCDTRLDQELLTVEPLPLFKLTLREIGSTNETSLTADRGWGECAVRRRGRRLELRWLRPANESLAGLAVTATAMADDRQSAFSWKLRIDNRTSNWSAWRVIFPQLALADLGTNAAALFPRGPGVVQRGIWDHALNYRGEYPGGWCTMQFLAVYREGEKPTGLYVAMHDPWGSTKDLALRTDSASHSLRLSFEHPVPDMGAARNSFAIEGEAVWQLLRGDWFDAAMVYKNWARREAKWWPRLGREGRNDTPRWMRELNVWTMTGGLLPDCLSAVEQFHRFLDLPLGFHWYNWHQIPFDNDYPHYFPAKDGFAGGVAELKADGVFPMPYINGRLWDSHDRGAEDFEFTKLALPSVTKQSDGSPYFETYNSKETNGQPVRLGVMCPTSRFWQNTVSNIVLHLLREERTSGVYIDQIAAAAPALCQDRTHGHPLGGGHWWTEGYWKMLDDIRRAKPLETILTTECNSEPFLRWFDGYLTWHWQFDGQVPAFPAIYGGAIQMFGRAYRGGPTRGLAFRMKAGQQLVYGEQLGWLDPGLVKDTENAEFFRQLVRLRAKFSRYFFAGQMVRPPKLLQDVPRVKADWQWSGEWWVTTDALLTSAWELPAEHRLLLLFVNVSDAPVTTTVQGDLASWRLPAASRRFEVSSSAPNSGISRHSELGVPVTFGPRGAQVWELKW
jgi:hypothetical protein